MTDKIIKSTFFNSPYYADCTSFVLTDLTLDPAVPVEFSSEGGAHTVKISKNNKLNPPAYVIKIWDDNGKEPADLSTQTVTRVLSPLKGSTAKKAAVSVKKKAHARTKTAKKKTAAKKKKR